MIWAVKDPLRYAAEVAGLDELGASVPGLELGAMRLGANGQLEIEFALEVGDRRFEGSMTYPQSFPAIPPTVRPKKKELWSGHQYASGGELCLEWGPDNWLPEITGADMIASTVKLLRSEATSALSAASRVATRHHTTIGQQTRHENLRLVCTPELEEALERLPDRARLSCAVRYGKPVWRAFVTGMTWGDGEEWADLSIPLPFIEAGAAVGGYVLADLSSLPDLAGSASEVRARLLGSEGESPADDEIFLCRTAGGKMSAVYLYHGRNAALPLMVIPTGAVGPRTNPDLPVLSDKLVAIIGCGSLGSKVGVSLARIGIRRFLLVDDDLMFAENIVRNELDWEDVGLHKVDALEAHLRRIAPDMDIGVRRHRLGGQEASGGLDSVIRAVAAADLIVEATASGRAFNYAAAAASHKVPMVWGEIFGGGFGGMIARSRPGIDPLPQNCRAMIEAWCAERNMPPPAAGNDYDGNVGDRPMIADDAAVGVIANHLAAMASDILAARVPPRFPASAYAIGMAAEWIFEAPFDTWPIDLGGPDPQPAAVDYQSLPAVAALQHLVDVVERSKS